LLIFFIFLSFLSLNLLRFYIFFEISLLPLLFILLAWGYQVERIQARFYLLLYTIIGSLPFLRVLLLMLTFYNSLSWILFKYIRNSFFFIFFIVFFRFFIKLPVYGFHVWLPKAHVEAPAIGSIILAAVLLKLGVYGLFRFFFFHTYLWFYYYNFYLRILY